MESGTKYDLAALLDAFVPPAAARLHDIPGPAPPFVPQGEAGSADEGTGDGPAAEDLTVERMEELVETTAAVRALLARYIRATFKPGLHFGIIPLAGQENSKPTLLKAGAEMICLLYVSLGELNGVDRRRASCGTAPWARGGAWPSCASRRCSTPTKR
jgi:hypothetical protein